MTLRLKPGTSWSDVYGRAVAAAPDAFADGRLRNLVAGQWASIGQPGTSVSPVDGSPIAGPPNVSLEEARQAVAFAADEHAAWGQVPLADRRARVAAAVEAMAEHRDTLALLLVWEIGKPWRSACADVDRCLDGVRWYVQEAGRQLDGRHPLDGPVSNIASWNYPMSVLAHAELVQLLAGNAVITKSPTQGGVSCLTVAHALMRRAGLPVSLLSGPGAVVAEALVRDPLLGALAFVGGRSNGGKVAAQLADTGKRHMIEQEGLNAWGIWDFSDWDALARHLKKGFEYGKQRCTAYPRYVVQRELFDQFLAAYLPVVAAVRFGHPLAVEADGDDLPDLDFGPVISADKARDLDGKLAEAISGGGVPLYRGSVGDGRFLPGQDNSAYVAPACVLSPPSSSDLMHAEPFGPIDTVVVVDTEAELLAAMNASNGALVASLACDDADTAKRLAGELRAYKVGINEPRSRGDKAETFGGHGSSWKGAFVGGDLLVQAVTQDGGGERLYGNFPTYSLYPDAV
jgi:acyl-CoA reductase-like NAD-dependent aldehyde dehydrogenase